jgi:alkylated DNA repair dioxygenase AlkB
VLGIMPLELKPIYLTSSVYLGSEAPDLIKALLEETKNLPWLEERSARREYFMSLTPRTYSYGNRFQGDKTYESNPFTPVTIDILNRLNKYLETEHNVCFLNRYEDEKQHLGWHADNFTGMRNEQPISVISLGAEREIWYKQKDFKGVIPPENKQRLEHGSLYIMLPGFQDWYLHRIPKHDSPCGIRISLTFRSFY